MIAPEVSLAFFDPVHDLYGAARPGMTLVFRETRPTAVPQGPELAAEDGGYRAVLVDHLDLAFSAVAPVADLGDARTRLCRVQGTVEGERIDGLGTATETLRPPAWAELDALRSLCAIVDADNALVALAYRPRGAHGHGQEDVRACLLTGGEVLAVEDARISTVYDSDGRQRSAGVEAWLPGEDFPRRASGQAIAATSFEGGDLRVNAAVFAWRVEGRAGAGAYDVTFRSEPLAAA